MSCEVQVGPCGYLRHVVFAPTKTSGDTIKHQAIACQFVINPGVIGAHCRVGKHGKIGVALVKTMRTSTRGPVVGLFAGDSAAGCDKYRPESFAAVCCYFSRLSRTG